MWSRSMFMLDWVIFAAGVSIYAFSSYCVWGMQIGFGLSGFCDLRVGLSVSDALNLELAPGLLGLFLTLCWLLGL